MERSEDTIQKTMNVSFVPSLFHLTGCRIVSTLFNHLDVQNNFRQKNPVVFKNQVKVAISSLTPNARLQGKLEKFIDPLFREVIEWLRVFERNWYGYDSVLRVILDTLPHCWLSDGTVDREKSAEALIKNTDLRPINRFVFACTYCFFDDAVELWRILFRIEKAYLKHKSTPVVKHWVEWLESNSNQSWEHFVHSTLRTPMLITNVFMLKHAYPTLSPADKSQYLVPALIGREVNSDVMRFCLSVLTRDEQEQIFKESPVEVFRCISSWPLGSVYYDLIDSLWPYITEITFCDILETVLKQIQIQNSDYVELLVILKSFWNQSPRNFKLTAKVETYFSKPLQFVLDCDVSQVFQKQKFLDTFVPDLPETLPTLQEVRRRRRRRTVHRRYNDMP